MTSKFIERYKEELVNRLKRAGYPKDRIANAMLKVEERIKETYTVEPVEIFNNIKNVKFSLDTEKLIDLILFSPSKPIITGYNTLFHNHKKIENIPGSFLDYLKQERGKAKNKAFEHINDEDRSLYNNHNTLQLILKLLANSYYGAFGQNG